jgi:hypothetical protein
MYMPEDDPEVISLFVNYLYRQELTRIQDTEKPQEKPAKKSVRVAKLGQVEFGPVTRAENQAKLDQEEKECLAKQKALNARLDKPFEKLFQLYYFAEMKFMPDLMNQTIDRIRMDMMIHQRMLSVAECRHIYDNTTKGSKLRSFCADMLTYELSTGGSTVIDKALSLMKHSSELSRDLMVEFQKALEFSIEMKENWDYDSDDGADPRDDHYLACGGNPCAHQVCKYHDHDSNGKEKICRWDSD